MINVWLPKACQFFSTAVIPIVWLSYSERILGKRCPLPTPVFIFHLHCFFKWKFSFKILSLLPVKVNLFFKKKIWIYFSHGEGTTVTDKEIIIHLPFYTEGLGWRIWGEPYSLIGIVILCQLMKAVTLKIAWDAAWGREQPDDPSKQPQWVNQSDFAFGPSLGSSKNKNLEKAQVMFDERAKIRVLRDRSKEEGNFEEKGIKEGY